MSSRKPGLLNANVCKNCRNLCYGAGDDACLQREAAGGVEHLPVLPQGGPRHHHRAQGGRQVSWQMLRGQDSQAGCDGIIYRHRLASGGLPLHCYNASHGGHRVQAFCPVVRIGSPHPLTRKWELLPLSHSLAGGGGGGPNSNEGTDTLVL